MKFSNTSGVQGKQATPKQGIIIGIIFAIVGIGLLIFSVSTITTYNQKNKTFVETDSVVVDYKYNDEGLQAIIVEYEVDGQTYKKTSNSYSNMPKSKGTQVKIKYDPNDPRDAIWVNDSTNIVLPLFGGVFALIGIIVVIGSVKKMKTQKNGPVIEQANGLYNNSDVVNSMSNNQSLEQQTFQNGQVIQNQQAVVQESIPMSQNISFDNVQQNQMGQTVNYDGVQQNQMSQNINFDNVQQNQMSQNINFDNVQQNQMGQTVNYDGVQQNQINNQNTTNSNL